MEPIYSNKICAVYKVENSFNPDCTLQLVLDSVGIFMSKSDIQHLLSIVTGAYEPCHCEQCGGKRDRIWCSNPIVDLCLKDDETILNALEDVLRGTLFILDMEVTLEKNKLIPGNYDDA